MSPRATDPRLRAHPQGSRPRARRQGPGRDRGLGLVRPRHGHDPGGRSSATRCWRRRPTSTPSAPSAKPTPLTTSTLTPRPRSPVDDESQEAGRRAPRGRALAGRGAGAPAARGLRAHRHRGLGRRSASPTSTERVVAAFEEAEKFVRTCRRSWRRSTAAGVPFLVVGVLTMPFEYLCGGRSFSQFVFDLYRMPDKVEAAMQAMMPGSQRRGIGLQGDGRPASGSEAGGGPAGCSRSRSGIASSSPITSASARRSRRRPRADSAPRLRLDTRPARFRDSRPARASCRSTA